MDSFAQRIPDTLEAVESTIWRSIDEIEEFCQTLEMNLRQWESEYEMADDEVDDVSYIAFKRDEAEERLAEARRQQQRVSEAAHKLSGCVRNSRHLAVGQIPEARSFVKKKAADLIDYFNVQPPFEVSSTGSDLSSASIGGVVTVGNSATDLSSDGVKRIKLPAGFRWLAIADISKREIDELPSKEDFIKVPYDKVQQGLRTFESEILPVLERFPNLASSDYFEEMDDIKRPNESGAQKIYDVFLGKQLGEHVRVERFGEDSQYAAETADGYQIINGRHRIKAAIDMGWKFIPAEVVDV